MDLITIVTYVCAILGTILLVLCIILVAFLIFSVCKRHLFPGINYSYSVVPAADADRRSTATNAFDHGDEANGTITKIDSRDVQEVPNLVVAESGQKFSKRTGKRNSAPIKKKLLWKKNKKKSFDGGINFSDEDLDVPRQPLFQKNTTTLIKMKSKSEWRITDLPPSNRSSILDETDPSGSGVVVTSFWQESEVGKSQYFDCLETIQEIPDEPDRPIEIPEPEPSPAKSAFSKTSTIRTEEDESDSEWESVSESEVGQDTSVAGEASKFPDTPENSVQKMQRFFSSDENSRRQFDRKVKRRIKSLKRLQLEGIVQEAQFYKEMRNMEMKYEEDAFNKIHEERKKLVQGNPIDLTSGIPGFWLHSMLKCDTLKATIQNHDIPILRFLQDVSVTQSKSEDSFRISFEFFENPYFEDKILTKDYVLRSDPDTENPLAFNGPQIIGCQGMKINWFPGKNVTLKKVKQIINAKSVIKLTKRNSFFNFFTPPKLHPTEDFSQDKLDLLEAHFELGQFFKEVFVPKATFFFLSDIQVSYKNLLFKGKSGKHGHQHSAQGQNKVRKVSKEEKVVTKSSESDGKSESLDDNRNEMKQDGIVANQGTGKDEVDINGRYRMISSDGFDDFMKALGVGMVKRKMANSVSPINIVHVDETGLYTFRTETTLKTSEIKFRLNEPFEEVTLDGRVTTTTAVKDGNVITLHQKGDKSKGEKDSMTKRTFEADLMYYNLYVDDVVCKRVYQKIQ